MAVTAFQTSSEVNEKNLISLKVWRFSFLVEVDAIGVFFVVFLFNMHHSAKSGFYINC